MVDDLALNEWRRARLGELASKVGGNAILGRMLGYKDGSFVGQMISGSRPITEKTIRLIEALPGCTSWFAAIGFAGSSYTPSSASATLTTEQSEGSSGELTINEYDTGGKMGHGLVLKDQPGVIRRWVVSPDWVQQNVHRITSPKNLAIVTGFGDSMRPLYNPGDPLLIDRGVTRADIDGIYFFRVGDEGYVKRLQRIPTANGTVIRAKSDNEKYDPFDITKDMDFEVFGRVVKAWRGEEF